jgi:hypothetical protein
MFVCIIVVVLMMLDVVCDLCMVIVVTIAVLCVYVNVVGYMMLVSFQLWLRTQPLTFCYKR